MDDLVRAVLKRWPRLALLVTCVAILSWFFFKFGFYSFEAAALQTHSDWLSKFAYAYDTPFKPDFLHAFTQGAFLTFFRGDKSYDLSLWTMHAEFIGSFVVFAFLLLFRYVSQRNLLIAAGLLALLIVGLQYAMPPVVAFGGGLIVATIWVEKRKPMSIATAIVLFCGGLWLLGYSGANSADLCAGSLVRQNIGADHRSRPKDFGCNDHSFGGIVQPIAGPPSFRAAIAMARASVFSALSRAHSNSVLAGLQNFSMGAFRKRLCPHGCHYSHGRDVLFCRMAAGLSE